MSREPSDADRAAFRSGGAARRRLVRGVSGSVLIKIAGLVLSLFSTVVFARLLGVQGFGIYAFCLSLTQILSLPAMLGGKQLLVREVAAYHSLGTFGRLRGVIRLMRRASFLAAGLLALAAGGVAWFAAAGSPMRVPVLIGLAFVPLLALVQLNSAALRGLQHILLGQAMVVLRPLLVILLVGLGAWTARDWMSPAFALGTHCVALALLAAASWWVLARSLPEPVRSSRPAFETAKWARSALPFLITGSMQIVNREISVTLLGLLQGAEQAGLYRVAQRGADLVPFGLMAVNMAIGPTVAQLFAQGRLEALQRLVSRSALAVLLFGLPVALVLIAGGQWLLPRLFGLGFEKAYPVLVLLSLGQLINTAFGSVGLVLNMSGLERFTALGVSIASVVNVLANLALIPGYGTVGAAIATSCSLLLWNSLLAFWLYRQTGLFCGAGLKRLIWSG